MSPKEQKEWDAHVNLTLGDWAPEDLHTKLRMIVAYIGAGEYHYPKDMHIELIKKAFDQHVIGDDLIYEPGNPLLLSLPKISKETVDQYNERNAELRKALWGEKFNG